MSYSPCTRARPKYVSPKGEARGVKRLLVRKTLLPSVARTTYDTSGPAVRECYGRSMTPSELSVLLLGGLHYSRTGKFSQPRLECRTVWFSGLWWMWFSVGT